MSSLTLRNIDKSFRTKQQTVEVFKHLSLDVQDGEFVALVGPSGCGKSTLFQMIGGLLTPDQGDVRIDGQSVHGKRGFISYVPQQNSLFPWRTVVENILLPSEIDRLGSPRVNEAKAQILLDKLGLNEYAYAYPNQLSGGMQQRIAFARALMSEKALLLLDEPFGALDALTRREMQNWLLDIWQQERRTVFMITHSIEEALFLADRIYVLSDKPTRIVKEITVPFARPRQQSIRTESTFHELAHEIYRDFEQ